MGADNMPRDGLTAIDVPPVRGGGVGTPPASALTDGAGNPCESAVIPAHSPLVERLSVTSGHITRLTPAVQRARQPQCLRQIAQIAPRRTRDFRPSARRLRTRARRS